MKTFDVFMGCCIVLKMPWGPLLPVKLSVQGFAKTDGHID